MDANDAKCPRCGGAVASGRLVNRLPQSAGWEIQWKEGDEPKTYTQVLMDTSDGRSISANRCERCGLLEFYARPER